MINSAFKYVLSEIRVCLIDMVTVLLYFVLLQVDCVFIVDVCDSVRKFFGFLAVLWENLTGVGKFNQYQIATRHNNARTICMTQ